MQAGTLVRLTKIKPRTYAVEGVLLTDVEVGKPVYLAGMGRNGELADGAFATSCVISMAQDGFATASTTYRIEPIGGEPGEFAPLAKILVRELQPHEISDL
jgi:hypothetical protein